jgi:hypothetical protein
MMNQENQFQFNYLQIEDIPKLIECVRRCYGESYPFKQIYSPSALEELVLNQFMHSVVCKDANQNVLGHGALTFSGEENSSPELGKLFVDPDHRGHHIADLLATELFNLAGNLNLPGFWSECVTNHPYSQDVVIAAGGVEVGLLLGDIPATLKMQGENNFSDSRMSLLTYYVPSANAKPSNIFIPESQANHIKTLASHANQARHISTELFSGSGQTKFSSNIDLATLDACIQITSIGSDFSSVIQSEIDTLEKRQLASIYIDLPIGDKAAAMAYLTLEKLGFFFGSWLPHFWKNQDVLRMQKIYTQLNKSEIICARDQGARMKEYVIAEMKRVS